MIDHCISYIFFNKMTFYKNMALLFIKTTTIGCMFRFLIHTLIKSIPYLFSRYILFCCLCLTLDLLVFNTLAFVIVFILVLIIVIREVLRLALILDWYTTSIVKAYSSRYFVWSIVSTYCGIVYSNSSLFKSSSHSSQVWWYQGEVDC